MVRPDFILIGAPKAGTSALFSQLASHPSIYDCPTKEPNFFALEQTGARFTGPGDDVTVNRRSITTLDRYEALFSAAEEGQLCGDGSTMYLASSCAAANIHRHAPEARLIVMLRDPIERAFSAWLHLRRDGREPESSFEAALAQEEARIAAGWEPLWHYLGSGRYYTHLVRYLDRFPHDRVKVTFHSDYREAPESVLGETFRFLGVDPSHRADVSRRRNISGVPRSRLLQRHLVGQSAIKGLLRSVVPPRARRAMYRTILGLNVRPSRPQLEPETRARILPGLIPEIEALEELVDRDLSAWKV